MKLAIRALSAFTGAAVALQAQAQDRGYTPPPPSPQTYEAPESRNSGAGEPANVAGQVRPSKRALPALAALQAAVNSGDVASIRAKAAEAQAVAATKEDRYLIGQLQLKAALATKDYALGAAALDAVSASAFLDAATVGKLYMTLGVDAYNAKQHSAAIQMFERAAALNPANSEALSFLGEALFAQGQKAQAVAAFQRAIQASGVRPHEPLLKRAVGVAYEARLPLATELGRQWVSAYPSPESWRTSLAIYRNVVRPDAETTLDLLRLMRSAGAMTAVSDWVSYANLLSEQSNFIEAQTALDQALAARKVDGAQLQPLISGLKAKPRATEAELAAAAASTQSGMALLRIGDRYYGLGQYAKAADLYRQAASKGVEPDLAKLRLGVALAGAGDKAGATAAFTAVSGSRATLAKYWLLYLQRA